MARILLVDDDGGFRRAVARELGNAGHAVVEAHSAEKALEILRHQRSGAEITFGLIITDEDLGAGMSGLEFVKAVRSLDDWFNRSIPIIHWTAGVPASREIRSVEYPQQVSIDKTTYSRAIGQIADAFLTTCMLFE
ncbi:response regulator [Patescibacteria group bacterium]